MTARRDRIVVCYFGEGATNIGGFHEPQAWPVFNPSAFLVCENNSYAMGAPFARTSPLEPDHV
ncbi:MAG: hypothetical protein H6715_01920 [Myxococcales bacterium]|nr:hypothetical protein [Myxococcales bacterium]